jgi:hypothetical protein
VVEHAIAGTRPWFLSLVLKEKKVTQKL